MALSEYVLLVSLSAGIHAQADTGGIAIGPEAITQPNGGVSAAAFKVADKVHKGSAHIWTGPTKPTRYNWNSVPSPPKSPATAVPSNSSIRPPPVSVPRVR
jgi:hypothetical protein